MTAPIDRELLFVAGLHRSGTTPLTRLLAAHEEISGFHDTEAEEDEGQHLQSVYPAAITHGGPGRFALNPAAHLTETSPLATSANADRLFESWAPHWDLSRRLLLEKSPPNTVMTRFLQELFPRARFVVVVRHPMIVALSTKKWRRGTSLARLVENWLVAHETLLDDAPHLERAVFIRYEEFVTEPAAVAARLDDFLDLATPLRTDSWDGRRSDRYRIRWDQMRTSRRPGSGLTLRWAARHEERARRFGYSLVDPDHLGGPLPFTTLPITTSVPPAENERWPRTPPVSPPTR